MVKQIQKKTSIEDWLKGLCAKRSELLIPGYWGNIEENCEQWAEEVSVNPYWLKASSSLKEWIKEYRKKTEGALLTKIGFPKFNGKKEHRIKSKLYNRHQQDSTFIPLELSKDKPPIPKLNDLVRTRISCQYFDGVEFLSDKLFALAKSMDLEPEKSLQGSIEGYFAQHVCFKTNVFYRLGGALILQL